MTAGLLIETAQPLPAETVAQKPRISSPRKEPVEDDCVSIPAQPSPRQQIVDFAFNEGPCAIAAVVCLLLILAIPVYHSIRGLQADNHTLRHILRAHGDSQQGDSAKKFQEHLRQLQWNYDDRDARIFRQMTAYEERIQALEAKLMTLQEQKPSDLPPKEIARYFGRWNPVEFELKEREEVEIIISITAHGGPEWSLKGIAGLVRQEDGEKKELGEVVWYVNDRNKHNTAPTFFWMGYLEPGTYQLNLQPVNTLADNDDILSVLIKRA